MSEHGHDVPSLRSAGFVTASPDAVFSYVDDHERLSSHMTRSSWMMGGGRMEVKLDAGRGRRLGSRIQMSGRAFGMELSLEELVSEYAPPHHKDAVAHFAAAPASSASLALR